MNGEQIIPCVVGGCDLAAWPHRREWPDQVGPMCYFKIPGECRKEKIMCPVPRPRWWRAFAPLVGRFAPPHPVPLAQLDFAAALKSHMASTAKSTDWKQRAAEPREPGEEG